LAARHVPFRGGALVNLVRLSTSRRWQGSPARMVRLAFLVLVASLVVALAPMPV
jgi:hypothetical protein